MKKYIIIALIGGFTTPVLAQEQERDSLPDTMQLGYQMEMSKKTIAGSARSVSSDVLDKAPEIDIAKALYGKIAGLNVYQGKGSSTENTPSLSIHGNAPLILVDGFPRSLSDISNSEIESIQVLKDAVASALYGVRGANGVILVTTKHGHDDKLKITAKYQYGISTQFRQPEFADAYTYANSLNSALALDGLESRYNSNELNAFKNNTFPYEYPNVNWWNEVYNKMADSHRLNLTFDGGSERFRYYSVIDYMHDKAFFNDKQSDGRYSTKPSDVRLNIRTNIDVDLTPSTFFKVGILGKLQESNNSYFISNSSTNALSEIIYNTPSAVFPVRHADGTYGGNSTYGANNPVALLESTGNYRTTYGTLLANATLKQELDILLKGLSAEVSVAFDNSGSMYDTAAKEYKYMDTQASLLSDGTLVTTPVTYGKDSETLNHDDSKFKSLYMRSNIQAKINYLLKSGVHDLNASLIYDQQSYTSNGRNKGAKRQSGILYATYMYNDRYAVNGVLNYSGTAYLSEGDRFHLYPAVSAAWVASNENFMKTIETINLFKLYASYGISGWDGNMQHELYRQSYGSTNGGTYYFTNNASDFYGLAEGELPVENLTIEKSQKVTYGMELNAFKNRLSVYLEGFYERRSNILINGASSVSGIIGIGVNLLNEGIQEYKGFDASISWNDRIGKDFSYSIGANASYVDSKVINDGQEYQQYDYLYTKGNRVGQKFGLEAIGFFHDQMDINNSPVQTFSTVRPGDIKYKDQNGDNKIDEQDMVKMFGSNVPRFYFGVNLSASYKNFEISADFQGMTGVTTNLLNSPLYKPLVNNGNISNTFLNNETPWTPENAANATMPRLTTQANANNYHTNSLWYRDGSFIKLRNLYLSYTFPKKMIRFADMKVYLQGSNLFSLDNISFADPEQLGAMYPSTRSYWMGVKFNF